MIALVTGAAGFIGQNLCRKLQSDGYIVAGLDIGHQKPTWCDKWFQADITIDPKDNQQLLRACEGVNVIFHLAAKVHALAEVKSDEAEYYRINTTGTKNILNAAEQNNVAKFVFFSTVKVYGEIIPGIDNSHRAITEQDETIPDTPYGQSKLDAEKLVLNSAVADVTILRLSMVYGPGAKGNILKMLKAIKKGIPLLLPDFHNKRSMVDVRDVVNAAVLTLQNPISNRQIYIVSDGKSYSTKKIINALYEALGKRCWPLTVPCWTFTMLAKFGDIIGKVRGKRFIFDSDALNKISGSAWFSSQKIELELQFKAEYSLEKSLPQMIEDLAKRRAKL